MKLANWSHQRSYKLIKKEVGSLKSSGQEGQMTINLGKEVSR